MNENTLDATGLICPLPVLRARKKLKDLKPNTILKIKTTDPASVMDFGVFCEQSGHNLIEQKESDGIYTFIIRRGLK
tara:strand:+ start:372 stop:602 length:231 start_codon:yes stop_codon:yes gene_type:complete